MKKFFIFVLLFFTLLFVGCKETIKVDENHYLVHFEVNGGEILESDKLVALDNACYFVNPTKDNYIFEGWFSDKDLTDGPYTEYTSQTSQKYTFYAKWYKVTDDTYKTIEDLNTYIEGMPTTYDLSFIAFTDEINENYNTYVSLPDVLKTQINNANKLIEAHTIVLFIQENQTKITSIANMIESITNQTQPYYALNDILALEEELKNVDESITKLIPALNNINTIKKNAEKQKELIQKAENLIKTHLSDKVATSTITLDDEAKILACKTAINNLPEELKQEIKNLNDYTSAYNTYIELKNAKELYADQVANVINLIKEIRYIVRLDDKEQIENARSEYNKLPSVAQSDVYNYALLEMAEERLANTINNKTQITYFLGEDVYTSRNELRDSVFGDFFIFIYSKQNGYNDLKRASSTSNNKYDLTNPVDFIAACVDWDYGKGEQRAIGDAFAKYLLKVDNCGFLKDQPETYYLGYCYKMGRNVEFFEFFMRFFAYWRIDEDYAVQGTSRADTFAESWSPTVDMCKFFHFTDPIKDSGLPSFYHTERLLDCFNNAVNVCYGDLTYSFTDTLTLPTSSDIHQRLYNFVGWYDNPNFEGEAITTLTDPTKTYTLYAKWETNTIQRQIDNALNVDMYLWNINSVYSSIHAEAVYQMYLDLNEYEKTLITEKTYLSNLKTKLGK